VAKKKDAPLVPPEPGTRWRTKHPLAYVDRRRYCVVRSVSGGLVYVVGWRRSHLKLRVFLKTYEPTPPGDRDDDAMSTEQVMGHF